MSNHADSGRENGKTGLALLRGLCGRCPACGEGRLFRAFVKVADSCSVCGESFHHHRADDFPAYLTIVLVGHVVVPLAMYLEIAYAPSYWVHVAIWLPAVLVLSLGVLQPLKGLIVAMQWHMGMHGFAEAKLAREAKSSSSPVFGGGARVAGGGGDAEDPLPALRADFPRLSGLVTSRRRAEKKTQDDEQSTPGVEQLGDRRALEASAQTGLEQHARLERMQATAPDQAGLAQRDLRARTAVGLA